MTQDASSTAGGSPGSERIGPGGAAASGVMTPGEALYWLERRARVQREEKTHRNTNRWTLRDIAAVEALVRAADDEEED